MSNISGILYNINGLYQYHSAQSATKKANFIIFENKASAATLLGNEAVIYMGNASERKADSDFAEGHIKFSRPQPY